MARRTVPIAMLLAAVALCTCDDSDDACTPGATEGCERFQVITVRL